jgi:hypothetical protein
MSLFTISGEAFFPLGGQAHNSSAYSAEEIAPAIRGVLALGGNTLEAPVYWEQLEPEEGRFDYAAADAMLAACREAGLALVVLWFGTWKNGEMRYVPEWVKSDRRRFRRVVGADGAELQVLSSYCPATLEADRRAFAALMRRLAFLDPHRDTVVAVQVENEPGILGSDRDYGDAAATASAERVPPELLAFVERRGAGPVYEDWAKGGSRRGASWPETYGTRGYEYREAWSIARFIDAVAAAGREAYDVPMYANAWLDKDGWPVPGYYPAGGPVARVLDIWKAATPNLALIAPDIYVQNGSSYLEVCARYGRDDNPLFVPESGAWDSNAMNMLRAVAEHHAVGYCCFGIDSVIDLEDNLRPEARLFAQSFAAVKAVLPLLRRFGRTGRVHAVVEEPGRGSQLLELERYYGLVPAGGPGTAHLRKDHYHMRNPEMRPENPALGLIVEAGPHELYLAGHFHLALVPSRSPEWSQVTRVHHVATPPDFLSVEEGRLDEDCTFVPTRKRNGDEVVFGHFWSSPLTGVTRVRLNPLT